jgi:hypothetical protein
MSDKRAKHRIDFFMLELEEDLAATYQDQGYVTVRGVLKPDDLQPFREVERAAYDFIFPKLRSLGWRPIVVRSRDGGAVTTFEQWQNA